MNDKVFGGILVALVAGWIGIYVLVIADKATKAEDEAASLQSKVSAIRKYANSKELIPTDKGVAALTRTRQDVAQSVHAAKAVFRERDALFEQYLTGPGTTPELGRWISLFADDYTRLEKDYLASLGDEPAPEKFPFKKFPDPKDAAELPQAQKNWTIQKTLIREAIQHGAQVISFELKAKSAPRSAAGGSGTNKPPPELFSRIPVSISLEIPPTKFVSYVNRVLSVEHITFEVRHLEMSKLPEYLKLEILEAVNDKDANRKQDGSEPVIVKNATATEPIQEPPVKLLLELDALDWTGEEQRP